MSPASSAAPRSDLQIPKISANKSEQRLTLPFIIGNLRGMETLDRIRVRQGEKKRIPAGTTLVFVANDKQFHRWTVGPQDAILRRVEGTRVFRVVTTEDGEDE